MDSRLYTVDSGFQNWRPGFLVIGFQIPIVSGISDSLNCIQDSKVQDSRFHKQKFPRFQNSDSLTWSETKYIQISFCYSHKLHQKEPKTTFPFLYYNIEFHKWYTSLVGNYSSLKRCLSDLFRIKLFASPHVSRSNPRQLWILDRLHFVDTGFLELDFGFLVSGTWIPDSFSWQIPKPRIPD